MRRRHPEQRAPEERRDAPPLEVPINTAMQSIVMAAATVSASARKLVLSRLRPGTLTSPECDAWLDALHQLDQLGVEWDPVAARARVGDRLDLDFVEAVVAARPTPPDNLEWYVSQVEWDSKRMQLAKGPAAQVFAALSDPQATAEQMRVLVKRMHDAIDVGGSARYLAQDVAGQASASIRERMQGRAYYPFGVEGLDRYEASAKDEDGEDVGGTPRTTVGAMPGLITVVTARPGHGKTSLLLNIALGQARLGRRGLYCAWETPHKLLLESMACIELGIDRRRVAQGRQAKNPLIADELDALEAKMREIEKHVAFMDNPFQRREESRATNFDNLEESRRHIAAAGAEWVVFDLWERCIVDSRPEKMTAALWRQQAIAADMGFHCFVAAQQNTKGEKVRPDQRPTLETIWGSGSYDAVADYIFGVWRPGKVKPKVGDKTAEVHLLKGRSTPGFAVEMDWSGKTGRLSGGRSIPLFYPGQQSDEFGAEFETARAATRKARKERDG